MATVLVSLAYGAAFGAFTGFASLFGGFVTALQTFSQEISKEKMESFVIGTSKFLYYIVPESDFYLLARIKSSDSEEFIEKILKGIHNRFIQELIGKEFYLEVKIYPHHVLRENKMITGAGADRMQTGMSRAFGKTIGRAALVKAGQIIFILAIKTGYF